jgi:two-component system, LytTR family, sensor kinase
MTRTSAKRSGDQLFRWVVVGSALVTVATVIGTRFVAPPEEPPGRGRGLPRVPPPPDSTSDLLRALGIGSLTWYACVLSAPLFLWLSRRMPIDRGRWRSSLAVHLLVVISLVLVTAAIQYRLNYGGSPYAPPLRGYLEVALVTGSLPFLTVAAAAHALEARTRAHDRELDAALARTQLAEVRLEALTAQLQPHFLFNTLQGISTLITRDPDAADRMLATLSDLLREVLRRGDAREIEVHEELRVLGPYLDIARWRFGRRLTITTDVDAESQNALVPFFILQPLVENSIRHGVELRAGTGTIAIRVKRDGAWLRLEVVDDGPGIDDRPRLREGTGLANTRARLRELYADRHGLELASAADTGSRVTVTLPFHVRAAAPVDPTSA